MHEDYMKNSTLYDDDDDDWEDVSKLFPKEKKMDVNRNHLVTDVVYNGMSEEDRKAYIPVPEELNRAARRKLGINQEVKVSFISNGKLSKWARKMRKERKAA